MLGSTSAAETPIRNGKVDLLVDCWGLLLFTSSLCIFPGWNWLIVNYWLRGLRLPCPHWVKRLKKQRDLKQTPGLTGQIGQLCLGGGKDRRRWLVLKQLEWAIEVLVALWP